MINYLFIEFLAIKMTSNFLILNQISKIFKIILFIIIFVYLNYKDKKILINKKIFNMRIENHSLQFYFFNYSGSIHNLNSFFKTNANSKFTNSLNLTNLDNFIKRIDFIFLYFENTKIENIFMLIIIFPFLKENCTIFYQIENRKNYNIYKSIFKGIRNTRNPYTIYLNDLIYFINNLKKFFFEWDFIPDNFLINNLRYIINNYYNETFLNIFDKSLNLN